MRFFPIMKSDLFRAVPWFLMELHKKQADTNHGQTLERLAERGGLCPSEALAVLEDRSWTSIETPLADVMLLKLVQERYIGLEASTKVL